MEDPLKEESARIKKEIESDIEWLSILIETGIATVRQIDRYEELRKTIVTR